MSAVDHMGDSTVVPDAGPQLSLGVPSTPRLGAELIVEYLELEHVPYAFVVCGHGNIGLLDAFYGRSNGPKLISMHREDAAGFAADAYFRVTHSPAVTITSCGPGSTNLLIALGTAFLDSSTFLAISGNVPTSQFNRAPFQEIGRYYQADFPLVVRSFVKRCFQPSRAEMLPLALRRAFNFMLVGRPGPVNIDVPLNVFREATSEPLLSPEPWRRGISTRNPGDPRAIEEVARLLLCAQRPLILAGHGAILAEASAALTAFSQATRIPVVTSPNGKGVIDERLWLALGAVGRNGTFPANQAARHADLIIALGTSFDDRAASSWEPGLTYNIPPTRLVQIDIDSSELGCNFPIEVGVAGDINAVLQQLLDLRLEAHHSWHSKHQAWHMAIKEWKKAWQTYCESRKSTSTGMDPRAFIATVRDALPDESILVADVGVHHNWLVQHWETRAPQTFLQSWGFAAMGFGAAGVLGAKLAAPDRPCISVCGDGGFLMTAHAVATAVEYDLPVIWIVWNNQGYVSILDQQLAYFGGREVATSFRRVRTGELYSADFASMARAMGAAGIRVTTDSELAFHLQEALVREQPTVIDAVVERNIRPAATGGWTLPPLTPSKPDFLEPMK